VVAAHLIIDAVGRTVYTRSPSTNSYVSASLDPIPPPARDVAVITSSDQSPTPPPVPATFERQRLHPPRPHTSRQMRRDTPLSPLSPPASTSLRYFLRPSCLMCRSPVLTPQTPTFLTTIQEANLSPTLASNFKDLLITHRDVFAKSPTDIGFCNLLEHDIDTADAAPRRKPPRRPLLASGTAEDDLVAEMLAAGVIEPSDSPWASQICLSKKARWLISLLR